MVSPLPDAAQQPDTSTPTPDSSMLPDATPAADTGPKSTGTLQWVDHFGTNFTAFRLVTDSSGNSIVAGAYFAYTGVKLGSYTAPTTQMGDALLVKLDPQGKVIWIKPFGGPQDDAFNAVGVDEKGDVYVAGNTVGGITIKDIIAGPARFIAKFSGTDGAPVWDHAYSGDAVGQSINLDVRGGTVAFADAFSGNLTYDTGTGKTVTATFGGIDIFLTVVDPTTGATQWTKVFGSSGDDHAAGLSVGADGSMAISDDFLGPLKGVLASPIMPTGTAFNGAICRFDKAGNALWAKGFGDPTNLNMGINTVSFAGGRIAFGGYFTGGINFGDGQHGTAGADDAFVAVIDDTSQNTLWSDAFGGSGIDTDYGIALDAWNNVVATGITLSPDFKVDGKSPPSPSPRTQALFLLKWNAAGKLLWDKTVSPTLPDGGAIPVDAGGSGALYWVNSLDVATAPSGNVILAGAMQAPADFGTGYQSLLSLTADGGPGSPDWLNVGLSP